MYGEDDDGDGDGDVDVDVTDVDVSVVDELVPAPLLPPVAFV